MTLDQLIQWAIPFAVGAILMHLWARYRRRLQSLRWSNTRQRIAASAEQPGVGKLELLFNGVAVTNVYLISAQVQNDSSSDLEKVELNFVVSEGTTILAADGQVRGSTLQIPLASRFLEIASRTDEQSRGIVGARRDFTMPVLNRGAAADF